MALKPVATMVKNAQEIRAKEIARRIGIEAMKSETIPIGKQIIASETALDRFFAERRVA